MIQEIKSDIASLTEGDDGLDKKKKELARLKSKKAELDKFLKIRISINGEIRTIKEWLEECEKLKSKATRTMELRPKLDEARTKVEVEEKLYGVRALIGYYSEDKLLEREARILKIKGLRPNDVFTNEDLLDIESRNPRLYELLPRTKDGGKVNIVHAKRVLLVLSQVFGNEFIYPQNPDVPELRGIIAVLRDRSFR